MNSVLKSQLNIIVIDGTIFLLQKYYLFCALNPDRAPPVLTCPQTIQKQISYDLLQPNKSATVAVIWDSPMAVDNTGEPTVTSTHEPGDEFSIGSTEVVYTAIDLAGNLAMCTFAVEVMTAGKCKWRVIY